MICHRLLLFVILFLFCQWRSTSANDREIGQSLLLRKALLRSHHRIIKSKKKSKSGSKGKGGKGKSSKSPKKSKSRGKGKNKKSKIKKSKGGKGTKKSNKSPKKSKGKKGSKGGSKGKKVHSTNVLVYYYDLADGWEPLDYYEPTSFYSLSDRDLYMTDEVSVIDFDTKRDGEMGANSGRSTNIGIHISSILKFPGGGVKDDSWRLCLTADDAVRAIIIPSDPSVWDDPSDWNYLGTDEPGTDCMDFPALYSYEDEPILLMDLESYNIEGEGKLSFTWEKNPRNDKPATTIVPSSAFAPFPTFG